MDAPYSIIGALEDVDADAETSTIVSASAPPPAVVPPTISECSLAAQTPDGVCVSDKSLQIMAKIAEVPINKPKIEILNSAKNKLNCGTTRCVLGHLGSAGERDITHKLKIPGPTDVSLLNNFNIDDNMKQWTLVYHDFFPYDFNMRDYEAQNKTLHTINMQQLYDGVITYDIGKRLLWDDKRPKTKTRPFRTAGCVINTDWYSGRGKHWMAFFVDMRKENGPWTVEFFNSSGNAPLTEYAAWMEKTKIELEQIISTHNLPVSEVICKRICVPHQRSRTECGVYSLFYIYCRLKGTPIEYFVRNRIADETMFEFRQHLFFDKSREQMVKFDYNKFKQSTNILWEISSS